MTFAKIIGVGGYLPTRILTNEELGKSLNIDTTWIESRTGIRQRYIADAAESTSDLALQASEHALQAAGVTSNQLGLIIVATSTPDLIFPSTACILQKKLKAGDCPAFDIQAVCAGFTYALHLASKLMQAGDVQYALVVGADSFSRFLDWEDKTTCVLFGDGAGAVVLSKSDAPGILASSIQSSTANQEALQVRGQVRNGQIWGDPFIRMEGRTVLKHAVCTMSATCRGLLNSCSLQINDVNWLILHQANTRIIEAVAEHLGCAGERVIKTISNHGNTSAASIPLALNESIQQGKIKPGDKVLIAGIGAGFTSGGALFII